MLFLLAGLKFTSSRFLLVVLFVIFTKTSYKNPRQQKYPTDVQKFPLRSNFCTSKRGLHPQLCQSVFAVAKTFNTSADWQNSLRKASFQRKLRQSALRCRQAIGTGQKQK